MSSIPDDKIQEVRDKVDIGDLIGRYVELRRAGQNLKGLCPFHQERTPSFNVNPARKGYKCFGCGASGDAIRFVMDAEGKSFPEAVRKLAELYGVHIHESTLRESQAQARREHEKDEAYAILDTARRHYREILLSAATGEAGRAYQDKRSISAELAERFQLGYAPAPTEAGWDGLARALAEHKLSLGLAERLGLVGRSERTGSWYDKFRGRWMFPIIAPGGETVAFSGRIVPPHDREADDREPPKYVNSPESLLYSKGKLLFGLPSARSAIHGARRAILVEGNVDVLAMHQRGHGETVAPLGTALTPQQAHLISRFTQQVVLCFDGDDAGKRAAMAALPLLLEQDLDVRIVLLAQGEDPDSADAQRLAALLQTAEPALEVMMVRLAARAGTAIDARARAFDRVLPMIQAVSRESVQALYADRAAQLFGIPITRVRAAVREKSRHIPSTSAPSMSVSAPVRSLPPLPVEQAELATLIVDVPHLATLAERQGALEYVTDARLSPIVRAVIDGAKRGDIPNFSDLLELVPGDEQRHIHDAVFSGKFRNREGTPRPDLDPKAELEVLIDRCKRSEIEREIVELDAMSQAAKDRGEPDEISRLQQRRLELRRRQDELRSSSGRRPSASQSN